jgi:hypothetical protein
MPGLLIVGGVVLLVLVWGLVTYNRFVAQRKHILQTWADIYE